MICNKTYAYVFDIKFDIELHFKINGEKCMECKILLAKVGNKLLRIPQLGPINPAKR